MPLFRRPDGDLITDESPVRRMIPYIMRGRNESVVYHDELVNIARVRPWMRAWNQSHPDDADHPVPHLPVSASPRASRRARA